jgi:hypothetical protein
MLRTTASLSICRAISGMLLETRMPSTLVLMTFVRPMMSVVVRLRVKGVEVAHAAVHVEIDHIASGGGLLQRRGAPWPGRGDDAGAEVCGSTDTKKSFGRTRNKRATGKVVAEGAFMK